MGGGDDDLKTLVRRYGEIIREDPRWNRGNFVIRELGVEAMSDEGERKCGSGVEDRGDRAPKGNGGLKKNMPDN